MDYTLPVARRTRSHQDKVFREMFETNKKKKRENRTDNASEEGSSGRDSDFESINDIDDVAGDERGTANGPSVEKQNLGNALKTRGTTENPLCIDGDEDDDEDDDDGSDGDHGDGDDSEDEERELSSDSGGDRSSDETYEVDEEDDEDRPRRRRRHRQRKEREGSDVEMSEKEKNDESDGESESEGVGFWMLKGSDEEKKKEKEKEKEKDDEKKKKNMEREREEGRTKGSSDNEISGDESDDVEFWMLSGSDEDQEKVGEKKEKKKEEREKEKTNVGVSASGNEFDEMEISSSEGDTGESERDCSANSGGEKATCVARRTRLRSTDGRERKKLVGLGTKSRPFCSDEDGEGGSEETGESSSSDNSEEEMLRTPAKRKLKCAVAHSGRGKDLGKGKAAKAKKSRGGKDFNVIQILLDSMNESRKVCLEELALDEKEQENEILLPLKFTFGEKQPDPPEKSGYEKELESMWSDFNIALASEEIGSSSTNLVESELDEDTLCELGKHQTHILDEQVGLICKQCSAVVLEIKYVMPSFDVENASGWPEFRDLGKGDYTLFFDDLGHEDSDCDALSDSELRARAKTVWDMIPGVRATMYPHQREGFEFIWKHVAGGIQRENFENIESFTGGRGCIISHAPGTGKSRLTIVFLQTYMKLHPKCLPVIIAPCSMLLTWEEEFKKWKVDIPFHNLNAPGLSGKEDEAAVNILSQAGGRDNSTIRMVKLYSWKKGGSVLGVSYSTFEKMVGAQKDLLGERIRRFLLDLPGLVVLDEGHIPRNEHSLIWQALSHVKTQKRILLSGTPFQNNFYELFNTMRVVNPKFSEMATMPATRNGRKRESQIKARKDWISLTKSLGKDVNSQREAARLKQIKSFIDPFVHIHRGDVLEKSLPGLMESIVVLKPSELQERLLQGIQVTKKEQLQLERAVSLISVHPSLLLDLTPQSFPISGAELEALRLKPNAGVKTKFLIGLIRLCTAINERVLVFSQYLDPLSLVMEHLKSEFNWNENMEVLCIDGKRDMKERQSAINNFNDPNSKARVLLVSTKAGGEGINLVGASRVVLLDVVWNPSVERQATRRAYRLGQKKFVYIYHLVTSGTIEEEKYSRQAVKDRLSKLVFSSSSGCAGNPQQRSLHKVSKDRVLDEMVRHEKLKDIFENISVKNKDSDLVEQQAATSSESDR